MEKSKEKWGAVMTKSELIENVASKHPNITKKHIEYIINSIFKSIKNSLSSGEKVEIRGFGSFKIREKSSKVGRNPKTGSRVEVPDKKTPYFKPGKEIKESLLDI